MGEQAKTIEYRFRAAIPHKARSFQGESKRSVEPQKTPMRLGRAMKNPTSATKKGYKKDIATKSLDFSRLFCFSALGSYSHEKKILNTYGV